MSLSTLRADHSDSCTLLSAGVGSHCGKKGEEERGETGGEERERQRRKGGEGEGRDRRGREEEGKRGRGEERERKGRGNREGRDE